ncbi:molybdopterin synthase catalytic subunit MoaE [Simiduia sp. 21SJ11W-1]|uniref:molybdopterin synthase catalytic subunit MoaE n=1 Tax=Simiduia sp. 21SJ11W-1 TaxID=2909669 RepID=UPI00209F65A8|nr:molybdopterin synthase catalytic subunit MoaE [Simiduia sp. 21SJ11W-1]UTA46760.1 molybdopterin synthase catalytic subunit MoaE [Simiduia sp. 21SJ11W-1]
MKIQVKVQTEDFDIAALYRQLQQDCPAVGAIVTFTGLVREINLNSQVGGLFLEHYPGMTEKTLHAIAEDAGKRWALAQVIIVHRVGQLHPADQIVYVGVNSAHRGDAFAACDFIMDFLKTRAPFWKRETTPEGERWVDARASDQAAAKRWHTGD